MAVVPSDHDIIMALGEDLPVGIWVARAPGGEEVYANRTFAQIMGTGLVETQLGHYSVPYGIYGRDGSRYPEGEMPFVRALREKCVVVADDITIRRPDGTQVDVRTYARPVFDPSGEAITHVIIAFFDITREVAAEQARAESEQRLARAQRLEAIGTLAGGIAHDFNNLIFGVKLIAAELATEESDPRRRASLALIDDITERSAALTRSLLGFARRGKHRAMAVGLSDVVASMAELLRRTAVGAAIELELEARDRGVVVGDQSQLEQVIMNLVGNARDAIAGAGHIVVRTRDAELGAGSYVVLEVCDDGPGIAPEIREHVFEPYFTTKNKGPDRGTGLGLATVYGIVELHHGIIEIDQGLDGRGTTFRVMLPGAKLPAEPIVAASTTRAPQSGTGLVLVVDDDLIVRGAVTRTLDLLGYQTLEAGSGAEAVTLYREHLGVIAAVVLDMVMPGMSGRATYVALREIDPEVRVLLVSGYAMNDEVQAILDLGVRSYLAKPHTVEQLAEALVLLTAPSAK
ncbi:MAG: response regulator [Deltaproteobacteria bacterium]|nr:response regulator [Deltaproteobacteria bacterium]